MWDIICKTADGFNSKFPEGKDPFRIITCLMEEHVAR
jgi:hypothetical protein